MTLPEKEPCLTPFLSSSSTSGLPQATQVFRVLSWKLKTGRLMLRVSTSPFWAPVTHTGQPSLCGTDSPLWPPSQEGLRTINSRRETNMGLSHTFPRIAIPSWWGLMYTASRGHLCWPHDPLQVTQQALVQTHSEQSAPSSAQISALRTGRTQSPDAQWGNQTGINWGTLNILELWTNTSYLKGNLWSEGTKHGYAKCLMNEMWSLDWAPFRGAKHLPTLFFIPALLRCN